MTKMNRCAAHRYRPAKSLCKSCGKGICEECERVHSYLCPSCAHVPGGNAARNMGKSDPKAKGQVKLGFGLPSLAFLKSSPLTSSAKRTMRIVSAILLTAACIVLLVLGAFGMGPFPYRAKKLASAEAERVIRQNLYLTVTAIDAYKKRTGDLPKTLDDIGMGQDATLSYQPVSKDRFVLSQLKYGKTVSYDSTADPRTFFSELAPPINTSVGQADAPAGK